MPTPKTPRSHSMRDSWPPTRILLRPHIDHDDDEMDDLDLSYIDKDPLNYFLTPAPSSVDEVADSMDFDAGIEDSKRPPQIVRSVSPSSLDGLSRLGARPPTPPRCPGSPSPESDVDMAPTPEDDDGEEYLGFGSSIAGALPLGMPFTLKDFTTARAKGRKEKECKTSNGLLSPTPLHAGHLASVRGRSASRPGLRPIAAGGIRRSISARSSPHAWREPSPDVWSIEEESDEELKNEMAEDSTGNKDAQKTKAIDIPASRPKKKVRFVLPAREM